MRPARIPWAGLKARHDERTEEHSEHERTGAAHYYANVQEPARGGGSAWRGLLRFQH